MNAGQQHIRGQAAMAPLSAQGSTARVRDPDATRHRILEAAFDQIYHHGYQGMRLDDVIAATGLTKGALYHHFANKLALGYAVVDEVIAGVIDQLWLQPLRASARPLAELTRIISELHQAAGHDLMTYGCPLNNLAQEMSPLDEGFRRRIDQLYLHWRKGLVEALDRAARIGELRPGVDTTRVAAFIVAALSGCIGMAKNSQRKDELLLCTRSLVEYLEQLRHA